VISEIEHSEKINAEKIRDIFQASYEVEAQLLNADDNFPPLKRALEKFMDTDNTFLGFFEGNQLAAVIEVEIKTDVLDINSLVVHPDFFRRGIASKLLNFVFVNYKVDQFIVETGAANGPAIRLYEQHGFTKVKQWMTNIGIEKVAFEKPGI